MSRPARAGIALSARSTQRGIALLRAALVPIVLLGQSTDGPGVSSEFFAWVAGVLAVYALASLAATFAAAPSDRLAAVQALLDLVFIALLVHASGGVRSPLQFTFYVLPIGAALRLSPKLTAAWAGLAVLAYLVVVVPHPATNLRRDLDVVVDDSLSLLWISAAAVMLSALVGRRQRELAALAATRQALVQQALDAEAREQRRLAEALHDHAIQNVLLARQEVTDLARGVPGAEQRARDALDETSRQLRREVFAMHPLGLERAGLGAVLQQLADDAARHGHFETTINVSAAGQDAGRQDLIVATARELLANAAKHAHAEHVAVRVEVVDGAIELTVADDGAGIAPGRLEDAITHGHIGLASVIERIRAIDGHVDVHSAVGDGTTVHVTIPSRS